jgi:hypothetical protein
MRTTERTWSDILQSLVKIAKENGFECDDKKVLSGSMVMDYNYYVLIFRHDFAKALWGEEEAYQKMVASYKKMEEEGMTVDYSLLPPPAWKRNLEALVLVEDKYLFLERHLNHIENGSIDAKPNQDEVDARREALVNSLGDRFKKK